MTAFTGDALATYGGGLYDYSPVIDATRDRPAAGANAAYAAVAGMTHTGTRAWVRMTLNGAAAPVLVAHDAMWGNTIGVAPVLARTGTGVVTITWPANVQDEIPIGVPGYTGPLPINLRAGWANARGTVAYQRNLDITSANVATLHVFNAAGTIADTAAGTDFDVYVI
jgi:hypothetical protein